MIPSEHGLRDGRTVLLREAEGQDAGAALDFIERVSRESDLLVFEPGEFELTEAEEADLFRKAKAASDQLFLLALIDGQLVGTLSFFAGRRRRMRHCGEFGMSVRKEFWGMGVGSLMLDTMLDWARQSGSIRKINLRVRTDNSRAIALYERCGFLLEGTLRSEIQIDGKFYDHHWMGLIL